MTIRRLAAACLVGLGLVAVSCSTPPSGSSNQGPLAIITPIADTNVDTGETINFDAVNSADPDGSIVAYNWEFGDFTTGSGVNVAKFFSVPGVFNVKLTVTDNKGKTASSTVTITVAGLPIAPTGLTRVGSGCCNTYGDFSWNPVPGAEKYEVFMDGYLGGGCLTDHSAQFDAPATSGRVQAIGLCVGSKYNVSIRTYANGQWSEWSPSINITL